MRRRHTKGTQVYVCAFCEALVSSARRLFLGPFSRSMHRHALVARTLRVRWKCSTDCRLSRAAESRAILKNKINLKKRKQRNDLSHSHSESFLVRARHNFFRSCVRGWSERSASPLPHQEKLTLSSGSRARTLDDADDDDTKRITLGSLRR